MSPTHRYTNSILRLAIMLFIIVWPVALIVILLSITPSH